MRFAEFQKKDRFTEAELAAFAEGRGIEDAPEGLPVLPRALLLPFHEIRKISWDEASGTGRVEAVRRNRLDEWFYPCHFLGDPVMPGCWGVDAIWQALRFFAAWRGLPGCGKTLAMENVSFFGQIRPHDREVVYTIDIGSVEEQDGERLITGKAAVSVDGTPVYTIGSAQVGTAYWENDGSKPRAGAPAPEGPLPKRLTIDEFAAKTALTHSEVLALSMGSLIEPTGSEVGLLPCSLMLEVGRVHELRFDEAEGSGRILASKANGPLEWFYPMAGGEKPTALTIDAVWQLMGLFLTWRKNPGTGRALGFERVEVFGAIGPGDPEPRYEIEILRSSRAGESGDAFVRADAKVFSGQRLVLSGSNFSVGCHEHIRYSDYPQAGEMGFGGKLKMRVTPA